MSLQEPKPIKALRAGMMLDMKRGSICSAALTSIAVLFSANVCMDEISAQERSSLTIHDKKNDKKDDEKLPTATALRLDSTLDDTGFPEASAWQQAPASKFDWDWQGKNRDNARETEVRILWTSDFLFFRFQAKYRTINVFSDARADGWRDKLWDRDVAEVFLQPDWSDPFRYQEFEVSPNGFWIDLNISHGKLAEMKSGLRRRVHQDAQTRTWIAELCIPLKSLQPNFDPAREWRVNFFRVEGENEPRFYSAWSPTNSPKPNFHVPAAFGKLAFRDSRNTTPNY
jgi:alpha-galactosidase